LAAKVTRSALQNAASIAALFLTTAVVIGDKPERNSAGTRPAAWAAWTTENASYRWWGESVLGPSVALRSLVDGSGTLCASTMPVLPSVQH
jgi:hypothetical protein